MHPLARHLADQGMSVFVPDIRGHGETGQRGTLNHDGQLMDDLDMLVSIIRTRHGETPVTLLGFSAGGGLAMRYGASPSGHYIDRYVFVAPALGPGAPTTKSSGDLWATPHVPRMIALSWLNRIGIDWFNGMEAIRFAVPPGSEKLLAPSYSYRLFTNLLPTDYAADLRLNVRPMAAVLAEKDELFDTATLRRALMDARSEISVSIVPDVNHIGLILQPAGLAAITRVLQGKDIEDRPDELDPDGVRATSPGEAPPQAPPQGG
ncbi:MAG: alpha/beta fold hydrolase [Proteobacteria bacterium]|nr:alpha/beta fold hydrolase [Pseudomonadota bacterium]